MSSHLDPPSQPTSASAPAEDPLGRPEVEAVLAARRELGPDYESALVDSFTERVEAALVARRAAERSSAVETARAREDAAKRQWVLALVSVAIAIPLTAVSAALGGMPALIVAWVGLVLVNLAHGWGPSRT